MLSPFPRLPSISISFASTTRTLGAPCLGAMVKAANVVCPTSSKAASRRLVLHSSALVSTADDFCCFVYIRTYSVSFSVASFSLALRRTHNVIILYIPSQHTLRSYLANAAFLFGEEDGESEYDYEPYGMGQFGITGGTNSFNNIQGGQINMDYVAPNTMRFEITGPTAAGSD